MFRKLLLATAGTCVAATAFADRPMRFDTHLEGYNAGGVPVPTSATGQARVEVIDGGTAIYFQVEVAGIFNVLMAHIHVNTTSAAPVQVTDPAGPIVFWFTGGPPAAGTVTETINGSFARGYIITDADLVSPNTITGLVEAIAAGRASVVIHTDDLDPNTPTGTQGDSRGGELRGTLQ
ncbi:MAG: CHRD domain-containing protein [Gammaproteobacteria bacterium]|nr:CHRD domain-containing protein [Gammaproteobacteria bacterium]MDH4255878.1 CHRD domain-containing protein [Gammaproteobacteria bacterium]MDH5309473.1 CHRD domain-containing protein [Gammaproteobacteria bacterium]